MIEVKVHERGSLFNRRLDRAIARALPEIEAEVAEWAADRVRARFDQVLRHDAPAYRTGKRTPGLLRSQVQVSHDPAGARVHNGHVVYRHWIEGTGSRNKSTRFKGYRTFRRVTEETRAVAAQIAQPIMDAAVRRF
jgi:hypothetical protein